MRDARVGCVNLAARDLARIALALGLANACARGVQAEDAPSSWATPERLTLRWAVERAASHSPEILAAYARWLAMAERPSAEGALPDPMLMLRYHNEDGPISFGESDFSFVEIGVEQEVPLAGKRGLRRAIAASAAERERAMRDMTALMVLERVAMQHAELAALEGTRAALEESATALGALIAQSEARYAVGMAEQQDALRARLERDMVRERLEMVAREHAAARAQLAALLGFARADDLASSVAPESERALAPLAELRARRRALAGAARRAARVAAQRGLHAPRAPRDRAGVRAHRGLHEQAAAVPRVGARDEAQHSAVGAAEAAPHGRGGCVDGAGRRAGAPPHGARHRRAPRRTARIGRGVAATARALSRR